MTHTLDSLMALHRAATSAAVQYADCARVSLRSERTIQAADDRDEANYARTALTEAQRDAQRYRWVRRPDNTSLDTWLLTFSNEELDAAIDAAMGGAHE
jgi:hypothetical protein